MYLVTKGTLEVTCSVASLLPSSHGLVPFFSETVLYMNTVKNFCRDCQIHSWCEEILVMVKKLEQCYHAPFGQITC